MFDALPTQELGRVRHGRGDPARDLFGALKLERGLTGDAIARLADGVRHAPPPPDDAGLRRWRARLDDAPAHVRGDYPEWLDPYFAEVFGDERAAEGAALASRAPVDLRVNTLKGSREEAQAALAHLGATPTPWSPVGLRITLSAEAKSPPIQAEPAFIDGLIEIQDEGSQLAALFAGAEPGETVIDLCAGGGGKTLALAALMANRGRLIATDRDMRRLAAIHARLARAGAQVGTQVGAFLDVRTPRGAADILADLEGAADLLLIDAPCTGIGAWRRNPDAKWRVRPGALEQRIKAQDELLDRAAGLVKPTGRIAYITCSLLDEENGARVRAFLARHPDFALAPPQELAKPLGARADAFRAAAKVTGEGVLMTPRRTGTDGFFVAMLRPGHSERA